MNHQPPRPHDFAPFEPDDFWLFIDAKRIRSEHRNRGQIPDSDHDSANRRRCQGCMVMALGGLLAFAGRANNQGWTRAEGLAQLEAHPATYDSMVKEGLRREGPAAGRLAKPYDAAFGAVYEKALIGAHEGGRLSVSVRAAQELLGFAIEMVQDQTAVIESGQMLSWSALEDRLGGGPFALPDGLRAWHLWDEIVAACDRLRRASSMLDDHVYRHSASASRQVTANHPADEDGSTYDPIANAEGSDAIGADGAELAEGITNRVVERLVRRDRLDLDAARAETVRALMDRIGPDRCEGADAEFIDQLAGDAIVVARRELAIRDAALAIVSNARTSAEVLAVNTLDPIEAVQSALDRRGVEHPYDLDTPDGRECHQRWLAVAAREASHLAQDHRLRSGTR